LEYQELIRQLTPELVMTFKRALELGRWPDGRTLTGEQREHCLQAVIAWDALHKPEQQRVGYIDRGSKQGQQCDDERPLKWEE
jgi:uncharacterized protein YeaC (DUF1315 family)